MLGALHRFGVALRSAGLSVTASDMATAAEAASALELGDRDALRAALKLVLTRRHSEAALFDQLFEVVFAPLEDRGAQSLVELDEAIGDERARAVSDAIGESSPLLAALLGASPSDLDSLAAAGSASLDVGGAQTTLQSGIVAYRIGAQMGLDEAEKAALEALRELGLGDDQQLVNELIRRRVGEVREALRLRVNRAITERAPGRRRQLALDHLEGRSFAGLSPREARELSHEVERLARAMLAARRRRRPARRRGRLDVARTLRRSLGTGGVPMVPRFVHKRPRRPRLVVLCDISDSVRNVSRFMLQLVYSIARLTDGVRAFAFVAELGEITAVFRRHSIERAVELVGGGAVVNVLANSNYGRCLNQFAEQHLGAVVARSTVIIIGDGRSNYHDPGLEALARIRRKAQRVLWLNPEPSSIWGFGDSAMNEYRELCDEVAVVGNLSSLRALVDELL